MRRLLKVLAIALAAMMVVVGVAMLFVPGLRVWSANDCDPSEDAVISTASTDLGTFPYHPLIYHLDLSILAYQVHGQSLVWPFDPYYEERAETFGSGRDDFTRAVRDWVSGEVGPAQVANPAGLSDVRGPGAVVGFASNLSHDPILYDYSRIHPWSSAVVNAAGLWTEYLTPDVITERIAEVRVAYRPVGAAEGVVVIDPVVPGRADASQVATDVMVAFEGGTGDKGEDGQPHSQSILGFVLARAHDDGVGYDVHVAFRGSRSGSAGRAFFEALSTGNASGNPDWITDLGTRHVGPESGAGVITTTGEVARGFAESVEATLPNVIAAMELVADLKQRSPENVFVTGHSLGGALAQHFTSAMVQGDRYGPVGTGPAMPDGLESWPWEDVKLITFGAPRAGDEEWARPLTINGLESEFYDDGLIPFDDDAIDTSAKEIVSRLLDTSRPVGFRVLISNDPITNDYFDGGKAVGKTVYVNLVCGKGAFGLPDPRAHEPEAIRDRMLLATDDERTPPVAWRYLDMEQLNPDRDADERGTLAEFERLRDAVLSYYAERDLWFDAAAFVDDFELMRRLTDDSNG